MVLHLNPFSLSKIWAYLLILFLPTSAFAVDIGIITAEKSEARLIRQTVTNGKNISINGIHYFTGKIDNKSVALVQSEDGSVNVSVAITSLINEFNPKYILFSGSAGTTNTQLNIGDVVLSGEVYSLDYADQESVKPSASFTTLNPIRNLKEPLIFFGNSRLLQLSQHIALNQNLIAHNAEGQNLLAKVIAGRVVSSDHFPNTSNDIWRMQHNAVDAVDMEGSSVMKICWIFKKNCLLIRGISNDANPKIANFYLQWNDTNRILAENHAGKVTIRMIKTIRTAKVT